MQRTFHFDLNELNLTSSQIESLMGYKNGEDRSLVSDLISMVLEDVKGICNIKAEYTVYKNIEFNNKNKSFEIDGLRFNIQSTIYNQIKKSDSVAFFLCTAGEMIGQKRKEAVGERDLLVGYIYDVVGSEVVELAADLMQDAMETEMAKKDEHITNRYSPGYCGWDISQQQQLFKLFPDNYCGITLTDSFMMYPVKSVSGIIGIGKNVIRHPYNTCHICDMNNCIYRR